MRNAAHEAARPLVLVVEDQAIIRLDLVADLEEHGFSVVEAADGETALALFGQNPTIEAAILDIDLPGTLTGYDLARRIRSARPSSTVIIISGSEFVMPADFDEHVILESKPLDLDKIALVLRLRHSDGD